MRVTFDRAAQDMSSPFGQMPNALRESNFYTVFDNIRGRSTISSIQQRGPIISFRSLPFGPLDLEQLLQFDQPLYERGQGASNDQVDELPVVKFSANAHGSDEKCMVCQCEYEEGDEMRALPCLHKFHKDCVDEWLLRKGECPVCRHAVMG